MNPLTNVRNIAKLNEQELKLGIFDNNKSWHNQYRDSAYIFIGGLPYDLTEGDVLCVFSQYGEIVNINLVRDKKSGKSKGYGFIAYEDQRSTILAVDNLNGIKLGGRTIRVDHVEEYRRPKGDEKDETGKFKEKDEVGCAPQTPSESEEDEGDVEKRAKKKKSKKDKKKKKAKKAEKRKKEKNLHSDDSSAEEDYHKENHKKYAKKEPHADLTSKVKHQDFIDDRRSSKTMDVHRSSDRLSELNAPDQRRGNRDDRRRNDRPRSRHTDEQERKERGRDRHYQRSRSRSPYYRR